ncbi:MAG: cysteine desulfurase family protein [Planctomycetota bacterium]|nr:cysteine desulfurase family protein [Planctomycetota bacterium]
MTSDCVYLDHAATTPVDERVLEVMQPWFRGPGAANPASSQHGPGRDAAGAVATAREHVAALLSATPGEIVFTSGATESCNLGIGGLARAIGRGHVVTVAHEHPAGLDPIRRLGGEGFEITIVPASATGVVTAAEIESALRPDTLLVSVMWANNELGTINDVPGIAALCHDRGVALHCDATQAVGKVPIDLGNLPITLLSCSAHKLYGPKGVGALFVRAGTRVRPIIEGGGHERGLRSGTLNVPGIVGFGEACRLCAQEMDTEATRLAALRDRLETNLQERLAGVQVNGDPHRRLPTITNLSLGGVEGPEPLVNRIQGVACAAGSACSSAREGPSHVLEAIGIPAGLARNALRLSVGRTTTEADVETAIDRIVAAVSD